MTLDDVKRDAAYRNAICSKGLLCDFIPSERSDKEYQVEFCKNCNKLVAYRIVGGRIDNVQYGRDHIRDLLQNGSQLFEQIYGKRKKVEKKDVKGNMRQAMLEAKEDLKFDKRKTFS